jgi:hypothetical protein
MSIEGAFEMTQTEHIMALVDELIISVQDFIDDQCIERHDRVVERKQDVRLAIEEALKLGQPEAKLKETTHEQDSLDHKESS